MALSLIINHKKLLENKTKCLKIYFIIKNRITIFQLIFFGTKSFFSTESFFSVKSLFCKKYTTFMCTIICLTVITIRFGIQRPS